MKRRLCKKCRDATGKTHGYGLDDCYTCADDRGSYARTAMRVAKDNGTLTAAAKGKEDTDGNRNTDGWENIQS